MLIKILLVIAILIQTVATAYALKLVRATATPGVDSSIIGFSPPVGRAAPCSC